MDFSDTDEQAAYRARAARFLSESLTAKQAGVRPDYRPGFVDEATLQRARAWQRRKSDAGFTGITVSRDWGGQGLTQAHQVIYGQEEDAYDVPKGVYEIGLHMCLPTLLAYATPQQLARFVPPALQGTEIWCQMFSEPGAGSDLAGLRTRATHDGDGWVLNGQKIWTSVAHLADFGTIIVRTDPSLPRHAGLTYFFIDMHSPGVTVRPIRQMSGASSFNAVFLDNVRVPDSQRLGEVNGGWKVAITTLLNERLHVGDSPGPDIDDLIELSRAVRIDGRPAIDDPLVRDKLARWYVQARGHKFTQSRTASAIGQGQAPGPEASTGKIVSGVKMQEIAAYGMELLGMAGIVADEAAAPMRGWFQAAYLHSPSRRISGGSDEILRNIVAERVLGLPPEPNPGRGRPFKAEAGGA